MTIKWSDLPLTPANHRPQTRLRQFLDELRSQPGRWAEYARYGADGKASARVRGATISHRYPEVEYAYRVEQDAVLPVVLYLRVKP